MLTSIISQLLQLLPTKGWMVKLPVYHYYLLQKNQQQPISLRCAWRLADQEISIFQSLFLIFVAGNATYKSPCRSVCPSVCHTLPSLGSSPKGGDVLWNRGILCVRTSPPSQAPRARSQGPLARPQGPLARLQEPLAKLQWPPARPQGPLSRPQESPARP